MKSVSKQATLFVVSTLYQKPPIFLTDKSFYRFEKICNHSKFQKFTTRVLGHFVVPVVLFHNIFKIGVRPFLMALTDLDFRHKFVIDNPETPPYGPMFTNFGLL